MGMGVDVRMNYSQMEEAASAYSQVAEQLHTLHEQMEKMAEQMKEGALLGDAGAELADAMEGVLYGKILMLEHKMRELQKDLNGAVAKMRDGVDTAESRFH